jgi:predicted DNA-binding transcriptional regulator AlpA
LLGISPPTLTKWIDRGLLPQPIRINGRVRIWPRQEIDAALDELTKRKGEPTAAPSRVAPAEPTRASPVEAEPKPTRGSKGGRQ